MKKLILLVSFLFLSSGCVTTTGVSVSHVWGDSGYSYPYIGGYTGAYYGSLGLSYIANPIFYTPYYYKRVYVKQPTLPVKHHPHPVYAGKHRAVLPVHNNNIHDKGNNTANPHSIVNHYGDNGNRYSTPAAPAPSYRDNGRNNNKKSVVQAPYKNNNVDNRGNSNRPVIHTSQKSDTLKRGFPVQQNREHNRTGFEINNGTNRISGRPDIGYRPGSRR